MTRFLARRAVTALVTLFIFVTVTYFLVNLLIPYDYATQFWFTGGSEAVVAVREQLGLGRPVAERYLDYLGELGRGSLGLSFGGEDVLGLVLGALPATLLIFGVGGIFAYMLGDWLARVVAWHRNRVVAGATTTASVLLYTAFPPFLLFLLVYFGVDLLVDFRGALGLPADSGPLWRAVTATETDVIRVVGVAVFVGVIVALAVRAWARRNGWRMLSWLALPAALVGVGLALWQLGFGQQALDVVLFRSSRQLSIGTGSPILAALAFVLLAFGEVMFVMRTGMAEEMNEDYVLTARAKGVPEKQVRDHHVGRNAILPALSRFFTGIPYLLTGLIIIERELEVGGLSSVFFAAVEQVDVPLIVGTLVAIGVLGLIIWLSIDVLHAALDPRIRYEAAE